MDGENDKRRLHRHEVTGEIVAHLRNSGDLVGKLRNVHREGLLLECPQAMIPEQIYGLRLTMSGGEVSMPWIELDAQCLWVAKVESGFSVGCMIVGIEPEALAVLRQLDM